MDRARWDAMVKRWGGYGLALGLRRLLSTLDVRLTHYDRSVDPALHEFQGRGIYIFWHEYITFPISCWGNYDIAMLVSQHRDADWLIHAAQALRFQVVRGSSTRGGSQAIRELKRLSDSLSLTITPDGPQGPRRQMALGPIYLSSRLGLPIIPVGFGYDRPWRFNTWDAFALPRPFSRARAVLGSRITIPPRLDRDELEACRQNVEWKLNRLTQEAEAWATAGDAREGEIGFSRRRRRTDPAVAPQQPWTLVVHRDNEGSQSDAA